MNVPNNRHRELGKDGITKGLSIWKESLQWEEPLRNKHLSFVFANLTLFYHKALLLPEIKKNRVLLSQIWEKQIKVRRGVRWHMSHVIGRKLRQDPCQHCWLSNWVPKVRNEEMENKRENRQELAGWGGGTSQSCNFSSNPCNPFLNLGSQFLTPGREMTPWDMLDSNSGSMIY